MTIVQVIMKQVKFFVIAYALFVTITLETLGYDSFVPGQKIINLAHKYVILHLNDELPRASEIFKTMDGINKLLSWEKKRNKILKEITLFHSRDTNKYIWFKNWRTRLYHFQELQTKFLHETISNYYDARRSESPWPKVTFDLRNGEFIINQAQSIQTKQNERELADPIATEEDIDHVLRFHRPYELNKKSTTTASMNSKQEIVKYEVAVLIKNYDIIDQNLIQNLNKVRYELLRESLKGKRMSELHYQERLFQAERIINQFEIKRRERNLKIFPDKVEFSNILQNDEAYRKYLNFDKIFYKGNIMYGYKNRLDDPASHDYGFEVNSKEIIGKRYEPMYELYKEMQNLNYKIKNLKNYELHDLPIVDTLLERYKTLTFWYPKCHFDSQQWFPANIPGQYIVKPRSIVLENSDVLSAKANALMNHAKTQSQNWIDNAHHYNGDQFKWQTFKDMQMLYYTTYIFDEKTFNVFENRVVHYLGSLEKANLLPSLLVNGHQIRGHGQSSSSALSSSLQPEQKILNIKDKHERIQGNSKTEDESQKFYLQMENLFDLNSNRIAEHVEQTGLETLNHPNDAGYSDHKSNFDSGADQVVSWNNIEHYNSNIDVYAGKSHNSPKGKIHHSYH